MPGKSARPASRRVFKLSSNETPLGPSPKAIEAYRAVAEHLQDYPDGAATRAARSDRRAHSASIPSASSAAPAPTNCSNLLAHAYLATATRRSTPRTAFWSIRSRRSAPARKPVVAPEKNYTADVDAILAKRDADAPRSCSSPTRTIRPAPTCRSTRSSACTRGLPPHVLLVLDAAYAEYVRRNDYEAGIELVATCENVVMTRTFSKIYGLAALRLGWIYGPAHVVDALNRIRGPFNVNAPAIAAGVAAIEDTAHVETARAHNDEMARLADRGDRASSASR